MKIKNWLVLLVTIGSVVTMGSAKSVDIFNTVKTDFIPLSQIETQAIVLEQRGDQADIYYPRSANKKFPIVALLQAARIDKNYYTQFGTALARYGFIVVIPNHLQELVIGPAGTPAITFPFPDQLVINDVLAQMEVENMDSQSPLFGIVDIERMAVVGHSAGGAAGLFALEESCNPPFCVGSYQKPQALIAGAFYGANTCNEGGNASDTRCINNNAVLPNPLGMIFDVQTEGLPVALLHGSLDGLSTLEEETATFEILDGPRKLITIAGTNHYGITNINNPPDAIPDPLSPSVSQDEAVARIAQAIADYLNVHLRFHLLTSKSADRLNTEFLEGDTLSGDTHIFLTPLFPDAQISQVEFFLDGAYIKTEISAPYDMKGTRGCRRSRSNNTRTLPDGSHTLTAEISFSSGGIQAITSQFKILNKGFKLFVSDSNDRTGKFPLEKATLANNAYIFLAPLFPDQRISRVDFYIDDSFVKHEWHAPYELKGTRNNETAIAFNTHALRNGFHKVSARIQFSNGKRRYLSSVFEISN